MAKASKLDESKRLELMEQVKVLPTLSGVYIMKDEAASVLYVGKAKNLRARVRSYFSGSDDRYNVPFLMKRIASIETIVTDNERQAYVLERDLITKYKPRYNIRLKDDKAYLSVRIDEEAPWPRLLLVRKVENDGARYFGPYTSSHELRTVLELVKKVVPLRSCSDTIFYNRQRPCLEYQIKRCLGPCCNLVDVEEYRACVKQAVSILEGHTDTIIDELNVLMDSASEDLRFEDAALYRDRIELVENFAKGLQFVSSKGENRDVFAIYREERLVTLSVLQVRNGRIADNVNFSFSEVAISNVELLESALEQFYIKGREIPEEIIVPCDFTDAAFLRELLQEQRGAKLSITWPKRGLKYRLLKLAELNAKQYYLSTFDAEARYMEIAKVLSRLLRLKQIPRKIECIDISNLQGSDIVGAIVAFYDGVPDKKSYKKYKITQQGKADDFAAINEVVTRRLRRGQKEDNLPDLLIIDGGRGQLSAALKARNTPLEIAALAKKRTSTKSKKKGTPNNVSAKRERVFIEGFDEAIPLEEGSEVTRFLQKVRDEAHRFVITFHRKSRSKRTTSSELDNVKGLGPERKRRLLKAFKSVNGVRTSSPEEIAKVGRMPLSLAEKILKKLGG